MLAEEYLAKLGEDMARALRPGLVRAAWEAVQDGVVKLARALGFHVPLTRRQVRRLAQDAIGWMERGTMTRRMEEVLREYGMEKGEGKGKGLGIRGEGLGEEGKRGEGKGEDFTTEAQRGTERGGEERFSGEIDPIGKPYREVRARITPVPLDTGELIDNHGAAPSVLERVARWFASTIGKDRKRQITAADGAKVQIFNPTFGNPLAQLRHMTHENVASKGTLFNRHKAAWMSMVERTITEARAVVYAEEGNPYVHPKEVGRRGYVARYAMDAQESGGIHTVDHVVIVSKENRVAEHFLVTQYPIANNKDQRTLRWPVRWSQEKSTGQPGQSHRETGSSTAASTRSTVATTESVPRDTENGQAEEVERDRGPGTGDQGKRGEERRQDLQDGQDEGRFSGEFRRVHPGRTYTAAPMDAAKSKRILDAAAKHFGVTKRADEAGRRAQEQLLKAGMARGHEVMPATGTTAGDVSLPLFRFVSGATLQNPARGMHWTHSYREMEQMASEDAGFIIAARHPGYERVLSWDRPRDRELMEREIGGYEYKDKVFPEVPIRPGHMDILRIVQVAADGSKTVMPLAESVRVESRVGRYDAQLDLFDGTMPVEELNGAKRALEDAARAADAVDGEGTAAGPGRAGVRDTVRKSFSDAPGVTTSVQWLAADLAEQGWADLHGRRVEGPAQLAEMAQLLRDPRLEHFHYFFVKDGKIVSQDSLTMALPHRASLFKSTSDAAKHAHLLRRQIERLGADGYYLVHNHPSGNPEASAADKRATALLAARVPGFRGHVVLDHDRYSLLTVDQAGVVHAAVHDLPEGKRGPDFMGPRRGWARMGFKAHDPSDFHAPAVPIQSR